MKEGVLNRAQSDPHRRWKLALDKKAKSSRTPERKKIASGE
jgi:hypothetical protein